MYAYRGEDGRRCVLQRPPPPMISDVLNTAVKLAVNLRGGDEEEVVNV